MAHAFYPQNDGYIEIYFDGDENWYYDIDGIPPEERVSFWVLQLTKLVML